MPQIAPRLSLLLLSIVTIIGCGKDTPTDPVQTNVTWTKPKGGSTFTYTGYLSDSLGRQIAGSGGSYTDSVIAHAVTARGVSGLVRMEYLGFYRALVDYRANGDLALGVEDPDGMEFPWSVFPVGSRGTITQEPWSLTLGDTATGLTTWSTPYATRTYLGAEQLTTGAGTFATHRILTRSYDTTNAGDPTVTNDTTWYAPTIGTYVRQAQSADMTGSKRGRFSELQSYSLK